MCPPFILTMQNHFSLYISYYKTKKKNVAQLLVRKRVN